MFDHTWPGGGGHFLGGKGLGGEGVVTAVHVLIAAPIHSPGSQCVLSRAHYDSTHLTYTWPGEWRGVRVKYTGSGSVGPE